MNNYEIYWNDLNDEAKTRLKPLYHENIDLAPLAIIDIEENSEVEVTHGTIVLDEQVIVSFMSDLILTNEEIAELREQLKDHERDPNEFPTMDIVKKFKLREINRNVQTVILNEQHITHE